MYIYIEISPVWIFFMCSYLPVQLHYFTYVLLTKREVKMAEYWPSSFVRFYGPRRSRGP